MKPYLLVAAILLMVGSAASQSCAIKPLMARKDVRKAMNTVRDAMTYDGHEHGFIVLPDAVTLQASASETEIKLRVPSNAVAFFHTHPMSGHNQPSNTDIANFMELRKKFPTVCSYVLGHEDRIWTVWEIFPMGGTGWVSFF